MKILEMNAWMPRDILILFNYSNLRICQKMFILSKQGRPPRESEKGAVRCGRRAMRGDYSVPYILILQMKIV